MKIAVLLACYNRKDKTLACLKSLSKNSSSVIVYITDDASTDGTSLAIRQYYSEEQVHIIPIVYLPLTLTINTSKCYISA